MPEIEVKPLEFIKEFHLNGLEVTGEYSYIARWNGGRILYEITPGETCFSIEMSTTTFFANTLEEAIKKANDDWFKIINYYAIITT